MKTKIIAGFIMAMLGLMAFSLVTVSAQEDEEIGTEALDKADEEAMASQSVFWDRVRLFFSRDREKEADIALSIANRYSLNAEEALEKGNAERAEESIKKAENMAEKAKEKVDDIETDVDEDDEDEEEGERAEEAVRAFNRSRERFEEHRKLVENVHSRILDNLSDKMTEEQLSRVEAAFSSHEQGIERARNAMSERGKNIGVARKAREAAKGNQNGSGKQPTEAGNNPPTNGNPTANGSPTGMGGNNSPEENANNNSPGQ